MPQASPASAQYKGLWIDQVNNRSSLYFGIGAAGDPVAGLHFDGTTITTPGAITVTAGGLTVTAGGLTVSGGGAAITGAVTASTTLVVTGLVTASAALTVTTGNLTTTGGDNRITAGNVRCGVVSAFATTEPTSAVVLKTGTAPSGAITTSSGIYATTTVMNKIIADGTVSAIGV